MTEPIIRVEGLGKCYRLGGRRERYGSLRESLMGLGGALVDRFRAGPAGPAAEPSDFWALRDVSFSVQPGEVVGIIGRNGAGKSTLLKLLSRITEPTAGRAVLHGRVGSLLEVGTGFHPELTGRENIYLSGAILGMKRGEIDRKFAEIVEFSGVEKFLDTPAKRYSSGMFVRLGFAVAAHLEPEILVIDEVLAVGDLGFQRKCLGKMGEVARSGRTVLFVSHNMTAVRALCTRGLLIDGGRIVADGPVETAVESYLSLFAAGAGEADLSAYANRQYSGDLRFTRFYLEDEHGRRAEAGQTGRPLSLVVEYESAAPLTGRAVHASIAVNGALGDRICTLISHIAQGELGDLPQRGRLRCRLDKLPLMPGQYLLDFYGDVNEICNEWLFSAASLNVTEGDYYGTGKLPLPGRGAFLAEHQWSVEAGHLEPVRPGT